jgi:anthranilate phosphoribosyltransferase
MVVHGSGLDEITTTGPSAIAELDRGRITTYTVCPEEFGFKRSTLADLAGRDAPENARILTQVLNGEEGPRRDIVLLNAGAAIYLGGKCGSIATGITAGERAIDSGAAYGVLLMLRRATGDAG